VRIRVKYSKGSDLKYIGHLDLYRAWERLIRRASLPIAYTQGFNPHPKINMSPALPLGFTSLCEVIDFWLEVDYDLDEVERSLIEAAPPGLAIIQVCEQSTTSPTIQSQIISARYKILLLDRFPDLDTRVREIMEATKVSRQRRGKFYDLRSLIENCEVLEGPDHESQQILLQLASRGGATGRPDEFLAELKIPIYAARIERLGFVFIDDEAPTLG
jgi:radical SAM-linked protein